MALTVRPVFCQPTNTMCKFWIITSLSIFCLHTQAVDMQPIDDTQQMISKGVIQLSDSLDRFFSANRYEKETSRSHIRISTGMLYPYGSRPVPVTQLRAKIELPNTQKRFNLVVENLSESLVETGNQVRGTSSGSQLQASQVSFSLRYFLINTKSWNAFMETGIKLVVPPDPFIKMRARKNFIHGKWQFRLTGAAFWFQKTGVGHREIFEIERPLLENLLFRQFNIATWSISDEITRFSHGYGLLHKYSKRDAFSYSLSVNGHNKPTIENTDYVFSINYRRQLYKTWLFFEAEPVMTWFRAANYRPEPSILLKLEFNFGQT